MVALACLITTEMGIRLYVIASSAHGDCRIGIWINE